ncbi:Zinc finger MYM-type protein 1 [Merluccius polli]|uniref:Zinc finger MYM-type protein 1 n=1 Tax=Merluccius polli TaxID=89951 RepID=A0AA47MGC4_MERPO|nr:Zinc finger MYM-type protein 1 [Merluccius polli]
MYQSDLLAVFRIMSENPDGWDSDTVIMASGYERVLQNKAMDIGFCCARIRDTIGVVEGQRQEFDSFYERFEQKCSSLCLTDSVRSQTPVRDERKRLFCNILDNITAQLKARFDHFGDLAFLGLVDCSKFNEMSQHFDDTKLQSLSKYVKFFDFVRLKADLIGLYSSETVRNECKSAAQLLNFLAQKKLMQTVPEVTKLLQLALTIPATTVSVERSFSALKRLKTYSRNRTGQGRLSSLAIIAIETERLLKLKEDTDNFYAKVTEIFVQKERPWLIVSLPDSQTLEVELMGDVTLSCTNVSRSPTVALWMRGDNTSKPIMISSVFGSDSSSVRYMDGFQHGRHVLDSNLIFINLTILQVEVSDSGWYFCLFYHETKMVMVNSAFLKINGDDTSHKEDDTNSESAGNWIMVWGMGAVNVFLILVILGLILKITHKSQLQRAWLVVSLPDSKTVEVELRDNVTLSCTNVSTSPTAAFWMRGDNTSKPIMISSVYGTDSRYVEYMDGFQQGRHVLEYNLFFINLTILQVEVSDSGWYFCLFYHETKLVMVNSTFLKINGDESSHKEDDTNSKSAGNWIMVWGMGAVNVFLVLDPDGITYSALSFPQKKNRRGRPKSKNNPEANVVYAATR